MKKLSLLLLSFLLLLIPQKGRSQCNVFIIGGGANMVCDSSCTGILVAAGTGAGTNLTYMWSSGAFGPVANNLCPGLYFVTMTDSLGCVATASELVVTDSLRGTLAIQSPSCPSCTDGEIVVTPINGVAPYMYTLNPPGTQTAINTFNNLGQGTYTVCITDALGCEWCSDSSDIMLNVHNAPLASSITISINGLYGILKIESDSELEILSKSIFDETGRLVISVYNSESSIDISKLSAGNYIIEIVTRKGNVRKQFFRIDNK